MKPKQQKRDEADARNARWAALDPVEQLEELHLRPGLAQRQRGRIGSALVPRQRGGA